MWRSFSAAGFVRVNKECEPTYVPTVPVEEVLSTGMCQEEEYALLFPVGGSGSLLFRPRLLQIIITVCH
jgi:hypothetical protein